MFLIGVLQSNNLYYNTTLGKHFCQEMFGVFRARTGVREVDFAYVTLLGCRESLLHNQL